MWCWGRGSYGRLGNGGSADENAPVAVGSSEDWISVSAGGEHGCGIRAAGESEGGSLWCWGRGLRGRLGNGINSNQPTPARVGEADGWLTVSAGGQHTCGIHASGEGAGGRLYCWGFNSVGQLGAGDDAPPEISVPLEVSGEHQDWIAVSAGSLHSCGIRASGPSGERTLWCWGSAVSGRLGNGGAENRFAPTLVFGGHTAWSSVTAGFEHTCAILASGSGEGGSLWCWGNGAQGRLGNGTDSWMMPMLVDGGHEDWLMVSAGSQHTLGLRREGSWAWGANTASVQLGDGTAEKSEPFRVENPDMDP